MLEFTSVSPYVLFELVACHWYLRTAKPLSESGDDVRWIVCVRVTDEDQCWFDDELLMSGQIWCEAGRSWPGSGAAGLVRSCTWLGCALGHNSSSTWARLAQAGTHEQEKGWLLAR